MGSLFAFIVLIGPLITIHELGHFLVAKLTGVRVLVFSLGFGPRLFGFKRGDTDYRISALPLGGYVRMYGDESAPDVPENEKHYAFLEKPWWVKVAIAFAGPFANLILPVGLFFGLHVGSEDVVEPVVGSVLAGEPAEQAGLKTGDRILSVDGESVSLFDDLVDKIGSRAGKVTTLAIERGGARQEITVTPKAAAAQTKDPSKDPSKDPPAKPAPGRIGLTSFRQLAIVSVEKSSPAAAAGIKSGDRIVSVDGVPVVDRNDLWARLHDPKAMSLVVERTPMATAETPKPTPVTTTVTLPALPPPPPAPWVCLPPPAADVDGDGVTDDAPCVNTHLEPPAPPKPTIKELRFAVLEDEAKAKADVVAASRAVVEQAVALQATRRGLGAHEGTIVDVEADTPAASRGLQRHKERVVSVDGKAIVFANDLTAGLAKDKDGIHVVGFVDDDGTGTVFTFRLQKSARRELGGQKILGIVIASDLGGAVTRKRDVGVAEAFERAVKDTVEAVVEIATGFKLLFTGQVGLDQVGGPVLIASVAGEAANNGVANFIGLMAMFSVNLGLLNLLPVPVLDGGHIVIVTIEALRGKKLDEKTRNRVMLVGLVLVGALMLVALVNDAVSLF